MFCSNCGTEIPEGAQFCPSCGTKVTSDEATETVVEAVEEATVEETTVEETPAEAVTEAVVEEAAEEVVAEETVTEEAPKVDASFYGQQTGAQQNTYNQATNQTQKATGGKDFIGDTSSMNLLQVFALIMMALYGLYTIRAVFSSIGTIFSLIGTIFHPYMYHFLVYAIGDVIIAIFTLLSGACAAVMAVSFYGVFRNWNKEVSRKYFVVLLVAGVASAAMGIVNSVATAIIQVASFGDFYGPKVFSVSGRPVVLVIAGILGYYFITNNMQAGPTDGGFQAGDEVKNAMNYGKELWADLQTTVNGGVVTAATATAATAATAASAAATKANDPFTPDFSANPTTPVNPTAPASANSVNNGGNNNMYTGALKTDRSIWAYIFLGIITCGIYGLYMMYTLERDINIACDGDGDHTTSFWAYLGLSIITCGIYHFYYVYKMGNRLQRNAPRYGLSFQENGTSVLMWNLFGMFLCGIGAYIAMNILLTNTNAICREYNAYNNL